MTFFLQIRCSAFKRAFYKELLGRVVKTKNKRQNICQISVSGTGKIKHGKVKGYEVDMKQKWKTSGGCMDLNTGTSSLWDKLHIK